MKKFILIPIFGAVVLLASTQTKPKDGFVPDADTAIKIAVAVWTPIYGTNTLANEKPYRARLLTNNVWKVEGSFTRDPNVVGGVMTALIAKEDGRILEVYHTK